MNSKLPHTWKESKLDLLIDFYIGGDWGEESQVSSDYTAVRVIRATDFSNWEKTNGQNAQIRYLKTSSIEKRELKDNDLVLEISGGSPDQPVGRSVIIKLDKLDEQKYTCSNFFRLLRINDNEILPAYLNYYFKFLYETRIIEQYQSNSTNLRNLKFKQFLMQNVPYPKNILEQQEIVQVLDTMSDIIRLREECISHAQDLIPALFQEMFGDIHNNKTNSQIVKLGDVADFIRGPFGGSLKKEIFVDEGYLVYEQYHAINNDFNFARYFIDEQKYKEMQRFSVKAGDLLISCSGTMGKIAIVPDNYKKGIINQALLKLTVNPEYLNNIFLKNLLLTDYYQKNYFKDQPGAAIQNVRSVKVLKNIDIILPSLSLQKQFVQKAIEIESYIKEQDEELKNAKQMFQSLLHHAFTGELTRRAYGEN